MMLNRKKIDWFDVINKFIMLLMVIICVVPFYYVITVSFSSPEFVKEGKFLLFPRGFTLKSYEMVLRQKVFFNAFKVSVVRTTVGTLISLLFQCMLAYAISRDRLTGKRGFMVIVLFTMLFNGGMIPTYLVVRYTGLINTIWALIIPNAINAWNVIILTNFFSSIPDSIEESASIDGANDIVIFAKIMIPLSIPAIATITLFTAVSHWNTLMDGVLYINSSTLKPLQVYLRDLVMRSQMQDMFQDAGEQDIPSLSIQTAAIFASTFPILVVYPFIQKYFIKGIMIGAVKG